MGLFQNILSKNKGIQIGAPMKGRVVSIKEVSDPTFSEEILGKGVALVPAENKIYSPVDGTVKTIFPTGHAVALVTREGAEILIHVGIDTVKLNGRHFNVHVKEGDVVKRGVLLLEADFKQIKDAGYDIITPVIVCNSQEFEKIEVQEAKEVVQGEEVMRLQK